MSEEENIPRKRSRRPGCWIAVLASLVYLFGIHPWWTSKIPFSVRSRGSRIKADLRSLSTALEFYYVDNNTYPAMRPLAEFAGENLPELYNYRGADLYTAEPGKPPLMGLTTPVSYISKLIAEPLYSLNGTGWAGEWPIISIRRKWDGRKTGDFWPYPYFNDRNLGWIIWAAGPDRVYDITDPAAVYDATAEGYSSALMDLTYDPTNGSHSRGDLWRVSQPEDRAYAETVY